MRSVGEAVVAEAQRLCPVDSGFLRSSIGYTYSVPDKRLVIHADARYSLFVELGTVRHAAQPYLRPALSAVPLGWRGGVGSFFTGHTVEVAAPNLAEKYHARTAAHTRGKIRGAKLKLGHGRFR